MRRKRPCREVRIEVHGEMNLLPGIPGSPVEYKTLRWTTTSLSENDVRRLKNKLEEQVSTLASVWANDGILTINAPSGHVLDRESKLLQAVGTVVQAFDLAFSNNS